jgi:hypothetical protein
MLATERVEQWAVHPFGESTLANNSLAEANHP